MFRLRVCDLCSPVAVLVLSLLILHAAPAAGQAGALAGRLWLDHDGNGFADAGEPGLAGVDVELLDLVGTPLASATSDATGNYSFTGLASGDYTDCG